LEGVSSFLHPVRIIEIATDATTKRIKSFLIKNLLKSFFVNIIGGEG